MEELNKIKSRVVLPYVEMVVTSICNMRCVDCSNNIPAIQHKAKHVSANDFMLQLSALINLVDNIEKFQIHGGEPLLNPELYEIVKIVCNEQLIKKIRIVTNGTILLSPSLIDVLSHNRVVLSISSYWFNEKSRKRVIAQCEEARIPYILHGEQPWYSFSGKPSGDANKHEKCPINKFLCYYDWKLYLCSRICHSSDNKVHSIDVRETFNLHKDLLSEKLKEWCKHCTICDKLVKSGVQNQDMEFLDYDNSYNSSL